MTAPAVAVSAGDTVHFQTHPGAPCQTALVIEAGMCWGPCECLGLLVHTPLIGPVEIKAPRYGQYSVIGTWHPIP